MTFISTDHLLTPRLGTDEDQNIVWRWDGDAFGQTTADKDPDVNNQKRNIRLRFPGQFHDGESGLYYNWSRYYDPKIGRYITSDPIGLRGGINTYSYVGQNPLYWIDPMGLEVWEGGGIGTTVGKTYTPRGNGNVFGAFTPQDGVCTGDFNFLDRNPCTQQCCIRHDTCFSQFSCNATSWWGSLNRWNGKCQACNNEAVDCVRSTFGVRNCKQCES